MDDKHVPFPLPPDLEVVGHIPVFEQGCFRRDEIYAVGKLPQKQDLPSFVYSKVVDGLRGREIELTIDTIIPIGVIDVRDPQ